MTLLILLVLLATIAVIGLILFSRQLKIVRTGEVEIASVTEMSLGDVLQCKIDKFYHSFGFFFHQLAHFAAFYLLLALRRLMIIFRYLLFRAEKKFSRLIDIVHGKGVIHKKGAVSVFLTQIKESK
jgi:hypothetical protein